MGKKKRGHPDLEELLARPWCYYCERDFDDLKILISHQKAKHFKCDRCGRRLNTAGGLSVHMSQVHKESLSQVDNALPNRSSLDIEIFGMEGVPEDILQTHNQRVLQQFQQAEAERRAATGNPPPGAPGATGQTKKPKFESPSDLKKRLAEHKAKLAEQQAGGSASSGNVTPVGAGQPAQSSGGSFPGTPKVTPSASQQLNGSSQIPTGQYGQTQKAFIPQLQGPGGYAPPVIAAQQYSTPQFPPAGISSPQYAHPIMASHMPPAGLGHPLPFQPQPQQQQPIKTHTPPLPYSNLPPTLPPFSGLPQRPSFSAPQVNNYQMQQLHHGQVPGVVEASVNSRGYPPVESAAESVAASADQLISEAAKRARDLPTRPTPPAVGTPEEGGNTSKPSKKEKAKSTRLVYSDNEFSPEEKLARLPRYAFVPEIKDETVLVDAIAAAVARPVGDADEMVTAT
ncbi:hypothetical protein FQN57_005892 [Myotisia sp. PD_48]|nr:hypothetical protein FQN57_005892 [Myotisia sp. PD_48]